MDESPVSIVPDVVEPVATVSFTSAGGQVWVPVSFTPLT